SHLGHGLRPDHRHRDAAGDSRQRRGAPSLSGRGPGLMLAVESIETSYGVSQVLFGVSFAVAPGQVATLLGRNGMGKTTTIRSIMGILPPKVGSISFEGRPVPRRAPSPGAQG